MGKRSLVYCFILAFVVCLVICSSSSAQRAIENADEFAEKAAEQAEDGNVRSPSSSNAEIEWDDAAVSTDLQTQQDQHSG